MIWNTPSSRLKFQTTTTKKKQNLLLHVNFSTRWPEIALNWSWCWKWEWCWGRKLGMRCKIVEQAEKQKLRGPKSPTEDQPATRQYTVVSKMPKDTKLQVSVKCPKCDLKFFKANLLEEHLKLHDGKKAKQCPVCQKSFNSNYHFKTHMRTHSHVKPFCCAVKVGENHHQMNLSNL